MTTPFSPDLYPKAKPARSKAERRPAERVPPHRTNRANGSRRFISISPTFTKLESSHPSPLFVGISQLVSVTYNVGGGEEIFGEGEDAQFVYKVVTGSVRVCKMLTDGQRHISCFHVPGDVFGLERTATHRMGAEAIEDSQVLMFRRSHVERLITRDLNAAHQMLGIFISKLDDAEGQMFRLGRQSALQRVAAFLVEIEGRLGRRGSLELPMTRRDIGDYLGLSIETVSRSISQLQRRHALDRSEPRRLVLDQTKIDAMVEY
jgi:CRP/FNR family transcriptional regulator, nitrogen fixation regulation protein